MGDRVAFYSTVAGLIPVLLLAGLLELRGLTSLAARVPDRNTNIGIVAAVVGFLTSATWGEAAALRALLHGGSPATQTAATNALVALACLLFLGALLPALANLEASGVKNARATGSITLAVIAIGVLVGLYACG